MNSIGIFRITMSISSRPYNAALSTYSQWLSFTVVVVAGSAACLIQGCDKQSGIQRSGDKVHQRAPHLPTQTEPSPKTRLMFGENGDFKVMIFTDLHYSDDEAVNAANDLFQERMLSHERPHLILYNGDMISDTACDGESCDRYKFAKSLQKRYLFHPRTMGIPYALNMGNHDYWDVVENGPYSRDILQWDMQSGENTYSMIGPEWVSGESNYHLEIFPNASSRVPAASLWVLDTRRYECSGFPGSGCVDTDQVDWLRDESLAVARSYNRSFIRGHVFAHQPEPELYLAYNLGTEASSLRGGRGERVNCAYLSTGFFSALHAMRREEQGLVAEGVWHGHEHLNDFKVKVRGSDIWLGYNRKSGHGGYGPEGLYGESGARVLTLSLTPDGSDFTWTEHIRLEGGGVIDQAPSVTDPSQLQALCYPFDGSAIGPVPTR